MTFGKTLGMTFGMTTHLLELDVALSDWALERLGEAARGVDGVDATEETNTTALLDTRVLIDQRLDANPGVEKKKENTRVLVWCVVSVLKVGLELRERV